VLVQNEGSVYLFCMLTRCAKTWLDEHVELKTSWFGYALVVEHKFAWGFTEGSKDRFQAGVAFVNSAMT
jgi:hypothetical protein